MKKTQRIALCSCLGLAALLYLLDLSKITARAGGVAIDLYPAAALTLLGLVLLWRMIMKSQAN
jgi:hypothetical protein